MKDECPAPDLAMMAGKGETSCLLARAGKSSGKAYVPRIMGGNKKDKFPRSWICDLEEEEIWQDQIAAPILKLTVVAKEYNTKDGVDYLQEEELWLDYMFSELGLHHDSGTTDEALEEKDIFPGVWKSQRDTSISQYGSGPADDTWDEKNILPGGRKMEREGCRSQHDPGPAQDAWENKGNLPSGWKSQTEAGSSHHDPGLVEEAWEEKKIFQME